MYLLLQVKFSVDEPDPEKPVKFDPSPPQQKPQQNAQNQPFNLPLRTQSFNQNHPAFPMTPPTQPDYLTTLRNVPNIQLDKGTTFQFPKNETLPQNIPSLGMQIVPPYQNMPHTQNMGHSMPQKPPSGYQQNPIPQNSFSNPQMSAPYQNMSFPSSHPFNTWKREEIPPLPSPSWWQNTSQPPPPPPSQNYRQDGYPLNFPPYSNGVPSYLQQTNPMLQKHDFGKPAGNQGGGDIFGSPWGGYSAGGYLNDSGEGNGNHGMSMRQAMLKEANFPGGPVGPPSGTVGRLPNVSILFLLL